MSKQATIHRMVIGQKICPHGMKAKYLLEKHGYDVTDVPLNSSEETERFKSQHGVKTTPQIFIDGERIGGHDDLRRYLGLRLADPSKPTYRPIIALFSMTALMALAVSYGVSGQAFTIQAAEWFIAFSMIMLAILKLQDISRFSTMFLNYDLLARRWVPYATLYPFAEGLAGVLMAGHILPWLSIPLALFIATIGAVSVFKAVYIDKRELKCACVGGNNNVPLGFVSLTENIMMILMALWMIRYIA